MQVGENHRMPEEEYIKLDADLLGEVDSTDHNQPLALALLGAPKWYQKHQAVLMTLVVVLIATASFGLGRLTKIQESKVPLRVEYRADSGAVTVPTETAPNLPTNNAVLGASDISNPVLLSPTAGGDATQIALPSGQVVGSKNGSKYHFPWCGGAKQIAPKNLVTFESIEAARAAGYTPAANCKGLK